MEKLSQDFLPRSYRTRDGAVILVATSAIEGQGPQLQYVQKRYSCVRLFTIQLMTG